MLPHLSPEAAPVQRPAHEEAREETPEAEQGGDGQEGARVGPKGMQGGGRTGPEVVGGRADDDMENILGDAPVIYHVVYIIWYQFIMI